MTSHDILFIPHGGGPMPLLGEPSHDELVALLKKLGEQLPRPSAVLMISAHWEAHYPTVTSNRQPHLIYDYTGFPKEAYDIEYPVAGQPTLAAKVQKSLTNAGLATQSDEHRGLDHGAFVPLKLMYPDADIPCVQLSLVNTLDANTHIKMGEAFASLEHENLLVIGSGFTFHNMREFFSANEAEANRKNIAFENWLEDTLVRLDISEDERKQRMINWESAPYARFCQPREEHLLPLHVCYGAARRQCDDYFVATVAGKRSGAFYWRGK